MRLLLVREPTSAPEFFCVETAKGLDLPSRLLRADDAWEPQSDGIAALSRQVLGQTVDVTCVGYVRNVVPIPDDTYSLQTPIAHVPVYRSSTSTAPVVDGHWLTLEEQHAELRARHWWRIAERSV